MTKITIEDAKMLIEAFMDVNKKIRAATDTNMALKYSQTDAYWQDIIDRYNHIKNKNKIL